MLLKRFAITSGAPARRSLRRSHFVPSKEARRRQEQEAQKHEPAREQPYLDGIEWRIVPSLATRILGFVAGTFDQVFGVTIPLLQDLKSQAPQAVCDVFPANLPRTLLVNRTTPAPRSIHICGADSRSGEEREPRPPSLGTLDRGYPSDIAPIYRPSSVRLCPSGARLGRSQRLFAWQIPTPRLPRPTSPPVGRAGCDAEPNQAENYFAASGLCKPVRLRARCLNLSPPGAPPDWTPAAVG